MIKRLSLLLTAIILFSTAATLTAQKKKNNKKITEDSWKDLSLREKIGQCVVTIVDFEKNLKKKGESIEDVIKRYPVGGVFMGPWLLDNHRDRMANDIKSKVEKYAKHSPIPMFIQEDYESGLGGYMNNFTELPELMAVGATKNKNLAYKYGQTIATEARSLGFNWLLHPVVDLNFNFLNSVVNTRSLTDNPDLAIELISQQLRAMEENGVLSTLKHFPGDGVDFRDQHQVTTVNSQSKEEWEATFGKVFKALIDSGASFIMPGHITLPAYQTPNKDGYYLPATLSKELLIDLLKEKLKFKGAIVTDALNMGGIGGYYPTSIETQIKSFEAGNDVMLWPDLAFIDSVEARINRGEIPMSRLDDAVERVWKLKIKLGLFDKNYHFLKPKEENQQKKGEEIAKTIAEKSLTLVRDKNKQIPFKAEQGKKILIYIVGAPTRGMGDYIKHFEPTRKALEEKGFEVDMKLNSFFYGANLAEISKNDKIIFLLRRRMHGPMGGILLTEDEVFTTWTANMLPREKVISISYGDPYVHNVYLPSINTCINAYSSCKASQQAVVDALTGKIGLEGTSPVNLTISNNMLRK